MQCLVRMQALPEGIITRCVLASTRLSILGIDKCDVCHFMINRWFHLNDDGRDGECVLRFCCSSRGWRMTFGPFSPDAADAGDAILAYGCVIDLRPGNVSKLSKLIFTSRIGFFFLSGGYLEFLTGYSYLMYFWMVHYCRRSSSLGSLLSISFRISRSGLIWFLISYSDFFFVSDFFHHVKTQGSYQVLNLISIPCVLSGRFPMPLIQSSLFPLNSGGPTVLPSSSRFNEFHSSNSNAGSSTYQI